MNYSELELELNRNFLIFDGNFLAHRAWNALKIQLTAPDGTPTSMIVGFMNTLLNIIRKYPATCKIVAFDAGGKNFRHELMPTYKATRKALDDSFRIQLAILHELLKFLGYNVLAKTGVEADDFIASCTKLAREAGYEVFLVASDKDLQQLLAQGVRILRPEKSDVEVYDEETFMAKYNFAPSAFADYLAMVGDKVDNIPGIKNVGEITASKLLSQFGSIEEIFAHLDELPNAIQKKLRTTSLDEVLATREITRLRFDLLDKDFIAQALAFKANIPEAVKLAERLGLSRLLRQIAPDSQTQTPRIYSSAPQNFSKAAIHERNIYADFKSEISQSDSEAECVDTSDVWDLRTAFYMLHPDTSEKKFNELLSEIRNSPEPAKKLLEHAENLEAEILAHEKLHDVMRNIDLPLLPVLVEMERHGIRLDDEKFLAVQNELEIRVSEIDREILNASGQNININSPKQVSWLLFEKLGFEPESKTKTGNSYSTDASVLERLAKSENPNREIPAMLLEHREIAKMLTGFVIPLRKAALSDGIIHTRFEAALTGTGRLSSRNPNLQNIPAFGTWAEKIKAGLKPVERENIFVAADYSQIELRILAYMSQEERLLEAFAKNRDIHTETASWVFGVEPEFVTPELRRAAKMINFGLIYGMSSFGLAERLNISRSEASGIIDRYFRTVPGVKNFLNNMIYDAKKRGYSRTIFGRIRPVNEIPARGNGLDRALINSPIQGTAADISRRAMIDFAKVARGKLLLQVHDSLVCECELDEAAEIAEIMSEIMRKSGDNLPLDVKVKTGTSLANV